MDKIGYALAILLAVFGLAAGAVLYELLQQYPAGSHGRDAILFGLLLTALYAPEISSLFWFLSLVIQKSISGGQKCSRSV